MSTLRPLPPADEQELRRRATALAGLSLGALAEKLQVRLEQGIEQHKGWAGQLVETALGSDAGPLPQPDLRKLGIEIKTLSVHPNGRPCGATAICHATIPDPRRSGWEHSLVRRKLARVLWVPLESAPRPLLQRRLGNPLLWSPSAAEELLLRADWEELMEWLGADTEIPKGFSLGRFLHLRSRATRGTAGATAHSFYLRPEFTTRLLRKHYW